jgi:hypothetical protein
MCYDLFYETIHGLTHPLKYDLQTGAGRHGVMGRGEDFDIIFEVEALDRLGATDCMNELFAAFYSNEYFPHFPVYYDVREKYGWEPIKRFLNTLNEIRDEIHVNTDDQECYYMSISVGEDVSAIYEAHNKTISQATKNKIKRYLDLEFLSRLAGEWLHPCSEPDWCDGCDLDYDGSVDFIDYAIFAEHWLEASDM